MFICLAMMDSSEKKQLFECLYQEYRNLMFHVARRILGDSRDAEDVVHEAFLKLTDYLEKISDPRCPQTRALIVTITEHKAIDLYRRRKRRTLVPFEEDFMGAGETDALQGIDEKDRLARAIASLPETYRSVLLLKYAQGYSTQEVARLLSMSGEHVKKTLQRARKRLESQLNEGEVPV